MRTLILGSGRGSNARALLEAYQANRLNSAKPVAIISDQPYAPILKLGEPFGVQGHYLDPSPFKTKLDGDAEQRYIAFIRDLKPDLIVLAGFMRVIKPPFLEAFSGKIINLHPSLLPAFKGLDAIRQAFDYGVKITGCTIHWVTSEVDGGPIIAQKAVTVETDDSLASLSEKVHAAEHQLLPETVAALSCRS